jgi:hypothetical protein
MAFLQRRAARTINRIVMSETSLLKLIEAQHRLALQVQALTGAIAGTCEQVNANNLRDLVLWKAFASVMAEMDPAVTERVRARLDYMLLSVGDDPAFGKAVHLAHELLGSHGRD